MNNFELVNIAGQKMDSLKEEAAVERLAKGLMNERPNILQRTDRTPFAKVTFIGWVAQKLSLSAN